MRWSMSICLFNIYNSIVVINWLIVAFTNSMWVGHCGLPLSSISSFEKLLHASISPEYKSCTGMWWSAKLLLRLGYLHFWLIHFSQPSRWLFPIDAFPCSKRLTTHVLLMVRIRSFHRPAIFKPYEGNDLSFLSFFSFFFPLFYVPSHMGCTCWVRTTNWCVFVFFLSFFFSLGTK